MNNKLHSTPELEQICKDIRGVEFLYDNGEPAYVAAASPLVGITVKPLEPNGEFLSREDGDQYLYCYISHCCESQEELEADFRHKHEVLVNANPDTYVDFEMLTGIHRDEAGSSPCPFS